MKELKRQERNKIMATRKEIVEKIIENEKNGIFDVHIDPINYDLCIPVTEKFPYVHKTLKLSVKYWWLRTFVVNPYSFYQNQFVMKTKVYGRENLKGIKSAIVTCNHVYMFDCLCCKRALKGHKLFFTAGWFNNMNSRLGEYMRASRLMPIPDDFNVLRKFNEAMEYHMKNNHYVLFYPEQSEWWMYEKPRPYKNGAFHYAARYNVPIIPMEICFKDTGKKDKEGLPIKQFNIYILKPVYPNAGFNQKQNVEYMRDSTHQEAVEQYEKFYQKKLQFDTVIKKEEIKE